MSEMEVLGSRILLRPCDQERSRRFYRDTLGLAVYREFGSAEDPGLVFFLGNGFLELSGQSTARPESSLAIWIRFATSRRSTHDYRRPGFRCSVRRNGSPGDWWRCGSRTRMECLSSWLRFPKTIRCGATNGDQPCPNRTWRLGVAHTPVEFG
jgi:hypothetical protein